MLKYLKHRTDVGPARTGKQRMENNLLATFWAHCGRSTTSSSAPKSTIHHLRFEKKSPKPFLSPIHANSLLCCLPYLLRQWPPNQNRSRLMDYNQKAVASTDLLLRLLLLLWGVWVWPVRSRRCGSCTIRLLFGYMSNFYGHTPIQS